jgi:hypothetical protein
VLFRNFNILTEGLFGIVLLKHFNILTLGLFGI